MTRSEALAEYLKAFFDMKDDQGLPMFPTPKSGVKLRTMVDFCYEVDPDGKFKVLAGISGVQDEVDKFPYTIVGRSKNEAK